MSEETSMEIPSRHGPRFLQQPGWSISFLEEDIQRPSDWRIHQPEHTVIVHLGGRMDALETELDGHGGSSGPAQAGEIWTIPGGRRYAASARGGRIRYAVISLQPQGNGIRDEGQSWNLEARAGIRDQMLHEMVRRLDRQLSGADSIMAAESAEPVLRHLRHYHGRGIRKEPPGGGRSSFFRLPAPVIRKLRRVIQERLAEPLRLEDLAAEAGVSIHQLLMGFRQAFGTTPGQYIIRQRLRAARHLLTVTRKDITTIALETGFSSHSHLTRVFHQATGCPPGRYRAEHRAERV